MIVTEGDIDQGSIMSEADILVLERKAFIALAKTAQTKARISSVLDFASPPEINKMN